MATTIIVTALVALAFGLIVFVMVMPILEVPPLDRIEETWWGPDIPDEIIDTSIRPFRINVSDRVINDLKQRLASAIPFQPPLDGAKQHYGINTNLLKDVIDFWRTQYDWAEREPFLNRHPQFKVTVQGLNIHYIHVKPTTTGDTRVLPLLLLHGWPESVDVFNEIIPFLTVAQPNSRDFVFEVIAPSLPGYGFSDAAVKPGLGATQMAVVMKNLMERLGIEKYYVQGGDWGAAIVRAMGVLYPDKLLGVHGTMCYSNAPITFFKLFFYSFFPSWAVDESHMGLVYPLTEMWTRTILETGYMHIQSTKPDTLGVALRDSPVGLAAYMLEKFITLTNPSWKDLEDGGLTKKFAMTRLLDNVMIYWVSRSITTSMRLYAETLNVAHLSMNIERIPITKVPSGCARFRHDLWYMPETMLRDKFVNLVHLKDYDTGHFAALEVPDVLARDIFDFVETVEMLNKTGKC